MKKVNYKEVKTEPRNILFASTSNQDYEMSRIILIESSKNSLYVVLRGSHCSCYGFEDIEWDAMSYTEEQLIKLPLDCGEEERELKVFLRRFFEEGG